jgi:hypothetical protein
MPSDTGKALIHPLIHSQEGKSAGMWFKFIENRHLPSIKKFFIANV